MVPHHRHFPQEQIHQPNAYTRHKQHRRKETCILEGNGVDKFDNKDQIGLLFLHLQREEEVGHFDRF